MTARSQHTSQVETMREQIADLEYPFENACLESNIRTRDKLMREYLDGNKGPGIRIRTSKRRLSLIR